MRAIPLDKKRFLLALASLYLGTGFRVVKETICPKTATPPPSRGGRFRETWRLLSDAWTALYLLEFVGATAVAGLGATLCRAQGAPLAPSLPLWWAGYLCGYNCPRLSADPPDGFTPPGRARWARPLRRWRVVVTVLAGAVLVAYPLGTGRPWLALAAAAVAGGLQFYSRPLPGSRGRWRLKNLPGLKSVLAAVAIAWIVAVWPGLEAGLSWRARDTLLLTWALLALQSNALVGDLRDWAGDRALGTRTLAVVLGRRRTSAVVTALLAAYAGLSVALGGRGILPGATVLGALVGSAVLASAVLRSSMRPLLFSVAADLFLWAPAAGLL